MMGSKVLLADDSVTIQKVVGIIFANEGYELTTVASGDAAIETAIEMKPDVMLVDALMPGRNGYEVCREIRQNPSLRHIAILLMTGAFEVVDEEKNRQSGADEFIIKPFESQALIDATNRMIALSAQRLAVPASSPAPAAAVATPVAVPVAASVDDIWATGFDTEPAVEIEPEPAFSAPPVMPAFESAAAVKATADDDLWGAFDMDSVEISPPPAQVPTPVAAAPDDDFFSFEVEAPKPVELPAEDEFILEEEVIETPSEVTVPIVTGFEPVGEQEIAFADFDSAPVQEYETTSLPAEDDFSTISFDEPVAAFAPVPPPLPPVVEIPPPVAPPVQAAAPVPEPQVPVFTAPAAVPASLDEVQLRALLATVSRDLIERIVWEVVPDLAETIIREEIRKLKAGIV